MKNLIKQITDSRNLVFIVFAVIAFSLSWSTVQVIQNNYDLQQKVDGLRDEISVLQLENKNLTLGIEYYKTDEFLELEARRKFNKVGAGEKVVVLPRDRFEEQTPAKTDSANAETNPDESSNFSAWLDFLFGNS